MSLAGKSVFVGAIAAVVAFACLGAFVLARGMMTAHANQTGALPISPVELAMEASLTGVAVGAIYRLLVRQSRSASSPRSH